jgi:hypothetical protein
MAKPCFCGCERKIPIHLFGLRTYNTRGRQVRDRLAKMENLIGDAPDPETQGWYDEGREIIEILTRVVHRQQDPRTVKEGAIREWQAEGLAARRLLVGRIAEARHAARTRPPT